METSLPTRSLPQKRGKLWLEFVRTCREEVVLARMDQQKLKLMVDAELLRSRCQQHQDESNRLKQEYSNNGGWVDES